MAPRNTGGVKDIIIDKYLWGHSVQTWLTEKVMMLGDDVKDIIIEKYL